jgi:hypothetical protein
MLDNRTRGIQNRDVRSTVIHSAGTRVGVTGRGNPDMKTEKKVSRREFIMSTAATGAAASFLIVKPESVRGTAANDAVTIGWVGLGGRGTADARGLTAAGGKIVALADVFQERIDTARRSFEVEDSNCFLGFDGYQKVCALKLDAVLFVTPPGFRPEEFKTPGAAAKCSRMVRRPRRRNSASSSGSSAATALRTRKLRREYPPALWEQSSPVADST